MAFALIVTLLILSPLAILSYTLEKRREKYNTSMPWAEKHAPNKKFGRKVPPIYRRDEPFYG